MHEVTRGAVDFEKWIWRFLPVVPLGCLIFEAVRWSSHALNYPQHFNDKCTQFGEVYYRVASSATNLLIENAIWLSPAVMLILLWNRRRIVIIYTIVCLVFSPMISGMVGDDLTSNVNCYRDIGLGDGMIGLFLFVQTFVLLTCSLIAFIKSAIRWRRARHAEPAVP